MKMELNHASGSSVANVLLKVPGWKIRGVTRDPTQSTAKALQAKGIEIVKGDANDVESVKLALAGADVFSATLSSRATINHLPKPTSQG
jgi:uncharacterized protein YbjT (DUF2867 family)